MTDFKEHEKNVTSYKKYEKKGVDNDALKPKTPNMGDLVGEVPEKLHIAAPMGETSVRATKKDENPLHGGDGKPIPASGKKSGVKQVE